MSPSRRRRSALRSAALAGALALAAAPAASPCGPDFPNRLLPDGDEAVLAAPAATFRAEIRRLCRLDPALVAIAGRGPGARRATLTSAEADFADATEALAEAGWLPRAATLVRLAVVRAVLSAADDTRAEWDRVAPAGATRPLGVAVPRGLPEEMTRYLRGAIAYHEARGADARAAWGSVLDLPEGERKKRSTWAAYMIGRSLLREKEPDASIVWWRSVRDLAAAGFEDRLDLAAKSVGWEARANLEVGRHPTAVRLYLEQMAAGADTVESLRVVNAAAWKAGPEALAAVAADPLAQRAMTAWLVSWRTYHPEEGRTWLAIVEAAGGAGVPGADRLAWAAYQSGDVDAATRWAARALSDAPIAEWVRAKLALRDGALDEAVRRLAAVARSMAADEDRDAAPWRDDHTEHGGIVPANRVLGELGVLHLARGQYADALDHLLVADYWQDAAYVAERVLTADELKAHVDRNWPERGNASPESPPPGDAEGKLERVRGSIRHLLARRLARAGRFDEARPYLPPELRPRLEAYAEARAAGRDPERPPQERAAALWRAARILRREGMELTGTELEPDWFVHGGSFEDESWLAPRGKGGGAGTAGPTKDERERIARQGVSPQKRFHYRYVAADLAWEAAALMPDGSEDTARMLCAAGEWLKDRDPKAADRFYKALVRRCGATPLGREADRLHWFPRPPKDDEDAGER